MDIMYILHTMEKTILEQHTGTSTDREFQGIILLKNRQSSWRIIFTSAAILTESAC